MVFRIDTWDRRPFVERLQREKIVLIHIRDLLTHSFLTREFATAFSSKMITTKA